jgi:predicted O-linked N-acetylglucosamine transferase (SPINDLY family)
MKSFEQTLEEVKLGNVSLDVLLTEVNRRDDLVEQAQLYQAWLVNGYQHANAYVVLFNFGIVLGGINNVALAKQAYEMAIQIKPDFIQPRLNLGSLYEKAGMLPEAEQVWLEAIAKIDAGALDSDHALIIHALNQLGRVLENQKRYDESETFLVRSLTLKPDQPDVLQHWYHIRQKKCDWPALMPFAAVTEKAVIAAASPLAMLAASNNPKQQLQTAVSFHQRKNADYLERQEMTVKPYQHKKLRIGYLSSDFCLHPVALLTVQLFELHDRDQFDIYAFSWSRDDGSYLRKRVVAGFDHFIDITAMTDEAAIQSILDAEIDILVDLHGITSGARLGILNVKPAPVVITYLGFPGPNGHLGIDYVLADRFILPEELTPFFNEKPLYLDAFQVSDSQRPVAEIPSRESLGFADDDFVFCSFNNNYKFNPEMFATWMRVLKRVPESKLMLLADNAASKRNMIEFAMLHGIEEGRLAFAERVAPANYLARYAAMDLFLDTFPFNAGTTANDALYMGLPILTYSGKTFASRYAGSLLHGVELDALICDDLTEYEEKAVYYSTHRHELKRLKQQLLDAKTNNVSWFNVPAVVKDIESAYVRAYEEIKAKHSRSSMLKPKKTSKRK